MTCNRNLGVWRSDEPIDIWRSEEAIDVWRSDEAIDVWRSDETIDVWRSEEAVDVWRSDEAINVWRSDKLYIAEVMVQMKTCVKELFASNIELDPAYWEVVFSSAPAGSIVAVPPPLYCTLPSSFCLIT